MNSDHLVVKIAREELSVCDGVFGMCAHVCTPGASRRGVQASGAAERQPSLALGRDTHV